jgi:hypothetical protein
MDNSRRKLVLGSAAVPLVLTVRPAGAHAKRSIACIADGKLDHKPPHDRLKDHEDETMRKWIDVYSLEVEKWDHDKKKMVWKKLEHKYICGTDHTYWKLDKDHPYTRDAVKTEMKRGLGVKEVKIDRKAAVKFYRRDDFEETGYAWETHGGMHLKKSCWNSIKPKHHYT